MGKRTPDITDFSASQLTKIAQQRQQAAQAKGESITLPVGQLRQLLEETAKRSAREELAKHSAVAQARHEAVTKVSQRQKAIRDTVGAGAELIAEFAKLSFIAENQGRSIPKLSQQELAHIEKVRQKASEALEALEDAAVNGDAAEQVAIDQKADEAALAQDPAAAAELINAVTEDQLSPEQVAEIVNVIETLAETDAEASEGAEIPAEEMAEAQKTSSALSAWANERDPLTISILTRYAQVGLYKKSMAAR